jgi:hypothetical protein
MASHHAQDAVSDAHRLCGRQEGTRDPLHVEGSLSAKLCRGNLPIETAMLLQQTPRGEEIKFRNIDGGHEHGRFTLRPFPIGAVRKKSGRAKCKGEGEPNAKKMPVDRGKARAGALSTVPKQSTLSYNLLRTPPSDHFPEI